MVHVYHLKALSSLSRLIMGSMNPSWRIFCQRMIAVLPVRQVSDIVGYSTEIMLVGI